MENVQASDEDISPLAANWRMCNGVIHNLFAAMALGVDSAAA
jgi:hypothetical protein